MGYRSTDSDPDVWINRATTDNGNAYYNYMLVYVDDVLQIEKNAQEDMQRLNQIYRLKEVFGTPDRYIGANVDKIQLQDGRTVWFMFCIEYIHGDIKNMDSILEGNKVDLKSFKYVHFPYPSSYSP